MSAHPSDLSYAQSRVLALLAEAGATVDAITALHALTVQAHQDGEGDE